jgi:uncharacterized membrane protein
MSITIEIPQIISSIVGVIVFILCSMLFETTKLKHANAIVNSFSTVFLFNIIGYILEPLGVDKNYYVYGLLIIFACGIIYLVMDTILRRKNNDNSRKN